MSNVPPPPGGYPQQPQQPQQPQYQPPQPQYQPPQQQPQYQQPQQFQPVNPAAAKSGNGCLKAFLIVTAICVVLGVVGTIALIAFGTKVVNDNFGEAKASDYLIEIPDGNCSVDSSGFAEVSGTITNKSDAKHVFRLTVDFVATDGTKIDTSPFVPTPSLSPGEKGSWSTTTFTSAKGKEITCKVSKVEYFGT